MRTLFFIFLIQGVLMSAIVDNIELNGTKVPIIFEEDRNLPIANMQIVFQNAGSLNDGNLSGLAQMSSKILNEGTKKDGSIGFAQKLESRAISLSASAGTETFVIEVNSLKSEFLKGIEFLKELLIEPNLSEDTFNKIKNMSIGELMRKESDYDYIANINLKRKLFINTQLQEPGSGTVESINQMSLQSVKEFLSKHLIKESVIIVIGGDLNLTEAKAISSDVISILNSGKNEKLLKDIVASNKKEFVNIEKEDTKQAYVYFGAPFFIDAKDEDTYKAKVAAFILGSSGFGSRMMEEIRVKRGLAYSAYSKININKSHSYFSGHLQTKLESKDEAIKVVKELIKDFVKKGATKKELDGAKKFLLGSEPLRNETLSQRLSRTFIEFYTGLKIGYTKEELEFISKLELEDLNKFIKSHSEIEDLTIAVVTNK